MSRLPQDVVKQIARHLDQGSSRSLGIGGKVSVKTNQPQATAIALPLCETRRKLDIQTYKGREGRQIATLFDRVA
jgi:hypothetical protein